MHAELKMSLMQTLWSALSTCHAWGSPRFCDFSSQRQREKRFQLFCPAALLVNDRVPCTNLCMPEVLWFVRALSNSRSHVPLSCLCLWPPKLIPLFLTHTPLFILPSLEHTQQFPHSYYIEAPTAAKAAHRATAASSPSFLLLRYVFFH